jgi:lysophospholipase L1-like esterase
MFMRENVHACRRLVMPLVLSLVLLLTFAPAVLASSQNMSSGHKIRSTLVGPKQHYLALGDSLAFGYQPDLNFTSGYVDDYYSYLQGHGVKSLANMACPAETSVTFLNGKCPYSYLRKFPYVGAQLNAALVYMAFYAGQVSPVTLDIGANDVKGDINTKTCAINEQQLQVDLATLDTNLTQVILPQIHAALTVHGQLTGDLVMMNYYDPYQNICPNSVVFTETVNQHLANDVQGFGTRVDVFAAFGGSATPNPHICSYTWMCSFFHDIHATTKGYKVIAATFENGTRY